VLSPFIKNLPFIFSIGGALLVFVFYSLYSKTYIFANPLLTKIIRQSSHKWYFDVIYNRLINAKVLSAGYFTYKLLDKGVIELFGPSGAASILYKTSSVLRRSQTGLIYNYI